MARAPTNRGLLLGLSASVLITFAFLTSVHERYAYAALIFLAPLIPDRRILAVWLGLVVLMTINVVAAVPPTPEIGSLLPIGGALGLAGSLAMLVLGGAVLWLLLAERPEADGQVGQYVRPIAPGGDARALSGGP